MEAESISSLSPLLQTADQWGEWLLLLPLLVALEAVLSADNAIALAAISRQLRDPDLQSRALNLGLTLALLFRLALIAAARWVLDFWPLQLLAAAYLLWLAGSSLLPLLRTDEAQDVDGAEPLAAADAALGGGNVGPDDRGDGLHQRGLGAVVVTLAFTDLAFSLDSVAAAVAVSDNLLIVMAGGVIGVIALRLTSALFVRWLSEYAHLEAAGYLAVALVGLRLVLRVASPQLVPPEWALLALVALLFVWGFSKRLPAAITGPQPGELNP